MRPRKKEVEAVTALLLAEHPDVDALAVAVIRALDEARADRTYYTVGVSFEGQSWCWGWYSTPGQAQKAVDRGTVPVLGGARAGVLPLYPEPSEAADAGPRECQTCQHPKHCHAPVPRLRGCVVGRPVKDKAPLRGAPSECLCEEFVA